MIDVTPQLKIRGWSTTLYKSHRQVDISFGGGDGRRVASVTVKADWGSFTVHGGGDFYREAKKAAESADSLRGVALSWLFRSFAEDTDKAEKELERIYADGFREGKEDVRCIMRQALGIY